MTAADLIVRAARIRTLDPALPFATALAVGDGVVLAVGDEADVAAHRGPRTEVVDLGGAALTPGWRDGHAHPVLGADLTVGVDLSGCADLAAVRAAVRTAAAEGSGWVTGWGLLPDVFADGRPTTADIDDVVQGRPTVLRMFDSHSVLASSEALRRAAITGPRDFATDSSIVCDDDGHPTGFLLESEAVDLVDAVTPERTPEQRRAALRAALGGMAAAGLAVVNVMDAVDGSELLLTALEDAADLPVRLRLSPWCPPGSGAAEVDDLIERQGRGGRNWRIGGVKFFLDGTIDGGTAWLSRPDCHGTSVRSQWPDPAAYTAALTRLARAGVGTSTHAIGDAAVAHAAAVIGSVRDLPTGHRHSIEHLELLEDDVIAAVAASGAVASMQPTHCTLYVDPDHRDNWSRYLGDERAARGWRIADVAAAGIVTTLGSDWPVAPYDARQIMAAARLRRTPGRPDRPAIHAEQALDAAAALAGYTSQAALAAGEADTAGRIAVGRRADLTAVAVDPVDAAPDEFAQAPVLLTVSGGRVVHRAL